MTGSERFDGPSTAAVRPVGEVRHVLISLASMIAMAVLVYIFDIPNPNMILITGLSVFTSLYGYPSGIASGLVMIVYSLFFFSTDHSFVRFTVQNLQKMAVILAGVALNTAFIGQLNRKHQEAARKLSEANRLLRADNHDLEEASMTDTLTGIRNRFAIRRDYPRYDGRHVHVMMLDIDDFKRINDTFGHPVGDYILKRVGLILRDTFGADWCYRYGGDEFLIVCPDLDAAAFPNLVSRVLREGCSICLEDKPLSVHMSAGYVDGDCELSSDLRLMMHQADKNLYTAKSRGKDQYVGCAYDRELAQSIGVSSQEDMI